MNQNNNDGQEEHKGEQEDEVQLIQAPPRPPSKRKKSVVWNYFTCNDAGDLAVCSFCDSEIRINPDIKKRTTSACLNHLRYVHKDNVELQTEVEDKSQSGAKKRKEELRKATDQGRVRTCIFKSRVDLHFRQKLH